MTVEEITDVLLRLLDSHEAAVTENLALNAILDQGVPRNPGEPPLREQLRELIQATSNGPVHQRFEAIRQQIRQAVAEDRRIEELMNIVGQAGGPVN